MALRLFRFVLPALLAAGFAAQALAETPTGRWQFETDPINRTCKLSGEMTVWPSKEKNAKPGLFGCRFIAVQSCTGEPPIEIKVTQTCTAAQSGNQVSITSAIEKTVSVTPKEMLDTVLKSYAPDHFMVSLNAAGDQMNGMFHSLSRAAVRFRRLEDLSS
jgi:hypothetical protein